MAKSIADSDTEQTIVTKNVDIVTTKLDPGKPATMASNDTSIDIPKTLTSQTSGKFENDAVFSSTKISLTKA